MNLREAFDTSRRGFLKGVGATVASAHKMPDFKSLAKASPKSSLHHSVLTSMGWHREKPPDLDGKVADYYHDKHPDHTITLYHPDGGYQHTGWSHSPHPDTPEHYGTDDDGPGSAKSLYKHSSEILKGHHTAEERAREFGDDEPHEPAKTKAKSKASNWGRTSKIVKGKPSQAKPSISMKEAFELWG